MYIESKIFRSRSNIQTINTRIELNQLYRKSQLNGNTMHLDEQSFEHLPNLRSLRLEKNMLQNVPTNALRGLSSLEAL